MNPITLPNPCFFARSRHTGCGGSNLQAHELYLSVQGYLHFRQHFNAALQPREKQSPRCLTQLPGHPAFIQSVIVQKGAYGLSGMNNGRVADDSQQTFPMYAAGFRTRNLGGQRLPFGIRAIFRPRPQDARARQHILCISWP